ncbi:unnamed protein product [Cylicocyclus nassatus]|uniref:Uncharacterized protein n=1 Tax=Cylicocyclus nassatus TaxID=53992 RepID=A0AA36M818_CYLNA|nr:unnamed protein product [Cylicocyclus nassatus]
MDSKAITKWLREISAESDSLKPFGDELIEMTEELFVRELTSTLSGELSGYEGGVSPWRYMGIKSDVDDNQKWIEVEENYLPVCALWCAVEDLARLFITTLSGKDRREKWERLLEEFHSYLMQYLMYIGELPFTIVQFVLTVVCDDVVVDEKATVIGSELGADVVIYLQQKSKSVGGWSDLEYKTSLASRAMIYLQCTYDKLKDDEFSGDPTDECKKHHLGDAALLYGLWRGAVTLPKEVVENVETYWSNGGEGGGESVLNAAIEDAKKKGGDGVGCAYYYDSFGIAYDTEPEYKEDGEIERKEGGDPVGDVACVFGSK